MTDDRQERVDQYNAFLLDLASEALADDEPDWDRMRLRIAMAVKPLIAGLPVELGDGFRAVVADRLAAAWLDGMQVTVAVLHGPSRQADGL